MSNFKGSKPADRKALQEVICEMASLRNHVFLLGAPDNPEVEAAIREADEHLHHASAALCSAIERVEKLTPCQHEWVQVPDCPLVEECSKCSEIRA